MSFDLPSVLPSGTVVDNYYEIRDHIGSGGFADVYSGVQRDTGMLIALKIMKPLPASTSTRDNFKQRFIQEAQIAARISHPNVVTTLACRPSMSVKLPSGDSGQFDRVYIVMELLEGRDLAQELSLNGPMTTQRAIALMLPCLDGLARGHDLGIVHKDLKPSNLFLTEPGSRVEVLKILDYGIARVGEAEREGGRLTQTGQALFTPQYVPPEYLHDLIATPAADVYQMGLILIEMLTGKPAVEADTFLSSMLIHTEGIKIPAELAAPPLGPLLSCATHRDHESRYVDASAMAEALEALGPGFTVRPSLQLHAVEATPAEPSVRPKVRTMVEAVSPPPLGLKAPSPPADPAPITSGIMPIVVVFVSVFGLALLACLGGGLYFLFTDELSRCEGAECLEAGKALRDKEKFPEAASFFKKACDEDVAQGCRELAILTEKGQGVLEDQDEATSLAEKACDLGQGESCLDLGLRFVNGEVVKRDLKRAAGYYDKGCDKGDAGCCTNYGLMLDNGDGVERDDKAAAKLYRKACEKKNAPGCNNLALLHEKGEGVKKDVKSSFKYYDKSCDLGSMVGCTALGFMSQNGIGTSKSAKKALRLYDKACEAGVARACTNLALMFKSGQGTDASAAKAHALLDKSCGLEGGGGGCLNLGLMYEAGDGVLKDETRSVELYRKACALGEMAGCTNEGLQFAQGRGVAEDAGRAADLYRKACAGLEMTGCNNLGTLYEEGKGVGFDVGKALKYYDQSCQGGSAVGCFSLARMHDEGKGTKQDLPKALKLFKKSCKDGNSAACTNAGFAYDTAKGTKQDYDKAVDYYEKACEAGAGQGCTNLGVKREFGQGIKKDLGKATALFVKGCDLGNGAGCELAGDMFMGGLGVPRDEGRGVELYKKACALGRSRGCERSGP